MGEGTDVVTLQSGGALIYGDGGTDRFEIYASTIEARGGADNDIFNINGGDNLVLRGDDGDDRFSFLAGSIHTYITGGLGNDFFNGLGQVVSGAFYGDAGNETFIDFRNAAGVVPDLYRGLGDDVYRAHPTSPANFLENPGEGTDTVEVSAGRSYTLPANIENITVGAFTGSLTGAATLTGSALDNVIRGYSNAETLNGLGGNDKLYGGDGADVLNGGDGYDLLDGQAGADSMTGGAGYDTYYVDNAADSVTELSGGGTDLVHTKVNYTLPAFVENGTIDGATGLTLTGNDLNNLLTGNAGVDHLIGNAGNDVLRGGANADFMSGGTGDDRYYVEDQYDVVAESPGEGVDTIYLNLTLPQLDPFSPPGPPPGYIIDANVENLVVTQFAQSTAFGPQIQGFIFGNALDNVITDSSVARTISAGAGADTIYGNDGNDYLIGGEGADTIIGGNGDDTIVGDGNGLASYSGDTLTGGAGSDSYYYYSVDESAPFIFRVDQITDFETGRTRSTSSWTLTRTPPERRTGRLSAPRPARRGNCGSTPQMRRTGITSCSATTTAMTCPTS
jgi:Ca2+-binding RTX toxin-like protein